jgi:23S rRNA pseudouridine2605 synthase
MPRMRLQRALARAGVASRRKAEELIAAGRVTVNGRLATIGESVDTKTDVVAVDGSSIGSPAEKHTWLALNKPRGVLTAARDQRGRKTVFDLLPASLRLPGLTYVGRLDYLTEGLLLLTTDGAAVHALTHPSNEVERVYLVDVRGNGRSAAAAMRRGVEVPGLGVVRPRGVTATRMDGGLWRLEVVVVEGRNREVRRLCEAVGLNVERLVRVRFGEVTLGNLAPGAVRQLTEREINRLLR